MSETKSRKFYFEAGSFEFLFTPFTVWQFRIRKNQRLTKWILWHPFGFIAKKS